MAELQFSSRVTTHGCMNPRLHLQVEAIIDVKLGDADADSYKYEPMSALLALWETTKKYKHGKHCHYQRKEISPFVLFVDIVLGREALVVLLQFSQFIAAKRAEPQFKVRR